MIQLFNPKVNRFLSSLDVSAAHEGLDIYHHLIRLEEQCALMRSEYRHCSSAEHLSQTKWRALVALHRRLMHKHCELYMKSQQTSAPVALFRYLQGPIMSVLSGASLIPRWLSSWKQCRDSKRPGHMPWESSLNTGWKPNSWMRRTA
jgi:hypothetical protein